MDKLTSELKRLHFLPDQPPSGGQQALGLAVAIGQALEHVECDMTTVGGRMPLGNSLRRGGRIVGIALATGHSC